MTDTLTTYATPVVRVTWTLDAVTDGGTRTDLVDLRHGRLRGHDDDTIIRRVVAVGWMGQASYASHVRVVAVETVEAGYVSFPDRHGHPSTFAEGTYNGPAVTA